MVRKSGFTFVEILIAMVFFMTIIASFAMVFPSGYHMNLKTYRQNQAVDLADAILHEAASKPFYAPSSDANPGVGDSLNNLQSWTSLADWTPVSLSNFEQNNPALFKEYDYTLKSSGSAYHGIVVSCVAAGCFNSGTLADNPLVSVTVNLSWTDNTNGKAVPRVITLTTYATYDR